MAYPTQWADALANGYTLQGTPLLVSEEGASMLPDGTTTTFKLSNKATAVQQVLKSTDSGATWATASYTLNSTANTITFSTAPAVDDLIMVNYTTTDNPTYPEVNSECLEIGDVAALSNNQVDKGNALITALINKVCVSTDDYEQLLVENISVDANGEIISQPKHTTISLPESDVQAKVLFTVGSENGRYVVYAHFKEIKFDTNVSGDDSLFQMLDNVTTSTDDNGATVLAGTKAIKTNYFVKEK
jgi:hypothetical protein